MTSVLANSPEELGKALKALREERGVTLEFIANKSKISLYTLGALEDGAFAKLPPAIFSRMFLRQYLALLQEEPSPWLANFERLWKRWEEASQTVVVVEDRGGQNKKWGVWILGIFLVMAAFGAVVWLQRQEESPPATSPPTPRAILEKLAPTPKPSPQVATAEKPTLTKVNQVTVKSADRPCWVEWLEAGKPKLRRLLPPGEQVVFEMPDQGGELLLGDAGAVSVFYGTTELSPAGKDGQVVRFRLSPSGSIQEASP